MDIRISRTLLLSVVAALTLYGSVHAQNSTQGVQEKIERFESQLVDAEAAHLNFIAPEQFRDARKKLAEATELFEKGKKIEDIEERLAEGAEKLEAARRLESIGAIVLKESLTARSDAVAAKAPELASEKWRKAEEALHDAGREIENGDLDAARTNATEALNHFREAELEAIRNAILGRTWRLRDKALELDADDKASVTYAEADDRLENAEKILADDRYQRAKAGEQAQLAADAYERASRIASVYDQVEESKESEIERLILGYEKDVDQIASALGLEPNFKDGTAPAMNQVLAAIEGLLEDRHQMERALADRDARLETLEERLGDMRGVSADLEAQRKEDRKYAKVRSLFTRSEADVVLAGEELVIRLSGFGFPVGSSEIQPQDFPLLSKLQQALRVYPASTVVIKGHTDSQGDAELNQRLSERRADAVMSYLVANMTIGAERITAVGYGETSPIASNETVEGRASNRRIDVHVLIGGER